MTRPVSVDVQNEVVKTRTQPFHLARLFFKNVIANISEGPSVNNAGINYVGGTLSVNDVVYDQKGFQSATLTMYDYGSSAVSIVLNNQLAGRPCELYLAYLKDDGSLAAPSLIVNGVVEPKDILEDRVVLDLFQRAPDSIYFPYKRATKENGFTVLGKRGSVIVWGADVYELTNG